MEEVYKYSVASKITALVVMVIMAMMLAVIYPTFIPDTVVGESPMYIASAILLVVLYLLAIVTVALEWSQRVIVRESAMEVRRKLKSATYGWHEIVEFGMMEKGFGHFAGRTLYIRTVHEPGRMITISSLAISKVRELVQNIIGRAAQAKIMKTENRALIPFTSDIVTGPWDGEI